MIVRGKAYIYNRYIREVDILVDETSGKIVDIKNAGYFNGDNIYDYSGRDKVILPGLIDIHVHLRDLEYSYKEDYLTGTAAAAAGGFTLVCDMPNTQPKTNTLENLMLKLREVEHKALIDYGVYYGLPEEFLDLDKVAKYIVGFKLYPNDIFKDNDTLLKLFRYSHKYRLVIVLHAEDPRLFRSNVKPGFERPPESEYSAIDYILSKLRCSKEGYRSLKLHFTHISSAIGAGLLIKAKHELGPGVSISIDTAPHYLLLDNHMYNINSSLYKVYPTLKTKFDNLFLYHAVRTRLIDIIASDHAPHALHEKLKPYDEASPGYPSLEVSFSLLATMMNMGLLSVGDIVRLYSYNPARLLGISSLYGVIKREAYASLTVVDLKKKWVVDSRKFFSKAKYSPYNSWELVGKPIATFIRGMLVYEDGNINYDLKGFGKNVRETARFED